MVIVVFKMMGVLMMILRKTEHIGSILIRNCVLNSLYLGFNTEGSMEDLQRKWTRRVCGLHFVNFYSSF
jgi:hypothetical protein